MGRVHLSQTAQWLTKSLGVGYVVLHLIREQERGAALSIISTQLRVDSDHTIHLRQFVLNLGFPRSVRCH